MENVLEIMPRYAPGKPPGPPFDANTSYDRSIISCAGTSTTCSATNPVPRSCGTTYKTPRLVHQPETQGHQIFAHRCAALCAPAARTGSNPTFHSEPEIRAHAQFGKRYSLASALVEGATPDCAHTHHSVKNTTRSCTDVVFVRDGLSPVSYLSPFVCAALSLTVRACLCFLFHLFPLSCAFALPPPPLPCVGLISFLLLLPLRVRVASLLPFVCLGLLPSSLYVCVWVYFPPLSRGCVVFLRVFLYWLLAWTPPVWVCFVCFAGLASFRVCVFCCDDFHGLFQKVWNKLKRSFETKAHSEKSMNVSDMKVTDKHDFLSRSMMIKAKNIIMKERDDQNKEHHHEGANLDQSCDQQD